MEVKAETMHNLLMLFTITGSIAVIAGVAWVEFKLDRETRRDMTDHGWNQLP